MFPPEYRPAFGTADERDWGQHHCPVSGCRYRFPSDLWPAAVKAHAGEHSVQEWSEIVDGFAERHAAADAWHAEMTRSLQADRKRVEQWRDAARAFEGVA